MAKRLTADTIRVITSPSASLSGYEILTRNTTSGVVEKKASNVIITQTANTPTVITDIWSGTQAQYDAIVTKGATTIYNVI
jgi:hypothetical protein